VDDLVPIPSRGRTFRTQYRIRLSDMDATGRLRLDGVARFLQDAATDDVEETGWGAPEHLWVLRSVRIVVLESCLSDRAVDVVTWGSAFSGLAAGRRWSLSGDAGGSIEVDSVWIHLGPDQRPARIEGFGVYAEATAGRGISTRLELDSPGDGAVRRPWPLRTSDVDLHGHVNNAVYWQAVEDALRSSVDPSGPLVAELDYRDPVDLADTVELLVDDDGRALRVGFAVGESLRAVARVEAVRPP
jgi:acyl-ACP thioesterase